jgi:hypothetical protein
LSVFCQSHGHARRLTGILRAAQEGNQRVAVRQPAQARLAHPPPGKGQMLDAPRPGGHTFIPMWSTPDLLASLTAAMILDWTTLERLAEQDRQDRLREWERSQVEGQEAVDHHRGRRR